MGVKGQKMDGKGNMCVKTKDGGWRGKKYGPGCLSGKRRIKRIK